MDQEPLRSRRSLEAGVSTDRYRLRLVCNIPASSTGCCAGFWPNKPLMASILCAQLSASHLDDPGECDSGLQATS